MTIRPIFASEPCTLNALPWEHLSLYPFCAEIHCFERAQIHEAVGLYILIVDEGEVGGATGGETRCLCSLEQHVYENPLMVSCCLNQAFRVAPKL